MTFAIVVDTCIARAAGTRSGDVTALLCCDVLDNIKTNGHSLAMSKLLYDEWMKNKSGVGGHHKTYASRYAITWFADMQTRGRVKWYALDIDKELRPVVTCAAVPETRRAIEKDLHVLETALEADKRVMSIERRLPNHLRQLCAHVPQIHEILWLNPNVHSAVQWLTNGAQDIGEFRLCQDGV